MRVELSSDRAAPPSPTIRLAWLACVLGLAHAGFSAYWALGGRCLLALLRLSRKRRP